MLFYLLSQKYPIERLAEGSTCASPHFEKGSQDFVLSFCTK
jgi:hypothetical protein